MSDTNEKNEAEEPDRSGGTGGTGQAGGSGQEPTRRLARPNRTGGGSSRALRRYGPIVAAAVVVVVAIAVFGSGGGDDDDAGDDAEAAVDNDDLVSSGPMTPQRAELEGAGDVDFGPHCDPDTERLELPTIMAAQCVEPFDGDNGGATSPGVTDDEILVVSYATDPALDPLASSIASGGGADTDPALTEEALDNYVRLYKIGRAHV